MHAHVSPHRWHAPASGLSPDSRDLSALAAFGALAVALAAIAARFAPDAWYRELLKPRWTPPDDALAPLWFAACVAAGIAAWLVWRQRGSVAQRRALALYAISFACSVAWLPLWIGLRQPGLAFADACVWWLATVATTAAFARLHGAAAWVFVPLVAAVGFVLVLTGSVWLLNR